MYVSLVYHIIYHQYHIIYHQYCHPYYILLLSFYYQSQHTTATTISICPNIIYVQHTSLHSHHITFPIPRTYLKFLALSLLITPSKTYLQQLVHQNTMRSTGGFSFASNRTMGSENPTVLMEMWEPRRCDDDVLLSLFLLQKRDAKSSIPERFVFFLNKLWSIFVVEFRRSFTASYASPKWVSLYIPWFCIEGCRALKPRMILSQALQGILVFGWD